MQFSLLHHICMYVCIYVVYHTHAPCETVRQNEMPLGTDTHVVPSNTVLDRGPSPPWEGGQNP